MLISVESLLYRWCTIPFKSAKNKNLCTHFAFKSEQLRLQIWELWRRKRHSQLPNSLPPSSFFSFRFFCRGKYTSFLFCTNKGLSPRHGVAMLGRRDWSLGFLFCFVFFKDPLRFLVSFPGWLGACCWLTPRYTHTELQPVWLTCLLGPDAKHTGGCQPFQLAFLLDILSQLCDQVHRCLCGSLRISIRPLCVCVCVDVNLCLYVCWTVYCKGVFHCLYISNNPIESFLV